MCEVELRQSSGITAGLQREWWETHCKGRDAVRGAGLLSYKVAMWPCVCIMGMHQKGKLRASRFHSMIHHVEFRIIYVPFCGSGIPEN